MHHPVNVAQITLSITRSTCFTEKKHSFTRFVSEKLNFVIWVGWWDPHSFQNWRRTPTPAHLTENGLSEKQVRNWKPLVTPWTVTSMVAVFHYLLIMSYAVTIHGSVLIQDSIYRLSDFLPLCWFSHPCNYNRNAYFGITITFIWFYYLLTWFATILTFLLVLVRFRLPLGCNGKFLFTYFFPSMLVDYLNLCSCLFKNISLVVNERQIWQGFIFSTI